MNGCPACGSDGREAMELARLRAKHQRYAEVTNEIITDQAAEIAALRDEVHRRTA